MTYERCHLAHFFTSSANITASHARPFRQSFMYNKKREDPSTEPYEEPTRHIYAHGALLSNLNSDRPYGKEPLYPAVKPSQFVFLV